MRKDIIDLKGKKFGELTVLYYDAEGGRHPKWICRCSCGNDKSIRGDVLKRGIAKTCGLCSRFLRQNKQPVKKIPLVDICRAARESGLSYGNYIARMEREMRMP